MTDTTSTGPNPGPTDEPGTQPPWRDRVVRVLQTQGLLFVLLGLSVAFSVASPFFLTFDNLLSMGGAASILGIMAVTQTFLLISGGVDISIGSVVAVSGVLLGFLYDNGLGIWSAVLLTIVAGSLIGLATGLMVVRAGLDPLVTTLGAYSVYLGLAFVISGSNTLVIDSPTFDFLGRGRVAGVPVALVIFLAIFAVGLFLERRMSVGRKLYAVGGNLEAARLSGIKVDRIRVLLYVASSISAALAGVMLAAQLSTSSPNVGAAYLLSVVTAVILGGASLQGGRGSLVGTLIAVAMLGILQNGFALLSFSSFAQQIVLGILLVSAVWLDSVVRRRSAG